MKTKKHPDRVRSFSLKPTVLAVTTSLFMASYGNAVAQQVALLDSGLDPDAGISSAEGFNYFDNITDTADTDTTEEGQEGSGTQSARLVAESFTGEVVPFVITNGDTTADSAIEAMVTNARDSALSDILGRDSVRVVGITWGTDGVVNSSAPLMSDLSGANKVIAILAGDTGSTQPNTLATSSFNLAGVIIVGATDADGMLLETSNRAGTTGEKFVAAVGVDGDDPLVGDTAAATARIAGIAGAVLLQNPDLTAREVVNIILDSAEDRGDVGTDSEYGRGVILNADQVLNNLIGTPTVPTTPEPVPEPSGGGGGGGGALLLVGGGLAAALLLGRKSSTKLEKTLVLDSYGRTFQIDLNDHVLVNDTSLHLSQLFNSFEQDQASAWLKMPGLKSDFVFSASQFNDPRIDFIEYFAQEGDRGIEKRHRNISFASRTQFNDQLAFTSGYQVSAKQEFGAVNLLDQNAYFGASGFLLSGNSFSSVLTGFSQQAHTASFSYRQKDNSANALSLGVVAVDDDELYRQHSFSTILQGQYQIHDQAAVSVQFGEITEKGSVLGGGGGGIFGVDSASTYAINLASRVRLSDKISFLANYGIARTHVDASDNSLLKDFSTLRSDWYSAGVVANNLFSTNDQFGFAMAQPLKVTSGAVDYSIPYTRLANTNIGFDTERLSLSETGATEKNFEAYYRTKVNDSWELGAFAQYRKNPYHSNEQGNDSLMMFTLRYTH